MQWMFLKPVPPCPLVGIRRDGTRLHCSSDDVGSDADNDDEDKGDDAGEFDFIILCDIVFRIAAYFIMIIAMKGYMMIHLSIQID